MDDKNTSGIMEQDSKKPLKDRNSLVPFFPECRHRYAHRKESRSSIKIAHVNRTALGDIYVLMSRLEEKNGTVEFLSMKGFIKDNVIFF